MESDQNKNKQQEVRQVLRYNTLASPNRRLKRAPQTRIIAHWRARFPRFHIGGQQHESRFAGTIALVSCYPYCLTTQFHDKPFFTTFRPPWRASFFDTGTRAWRAGLSGSCWASKISRAVRCRTTTVRSGRLRY